MRKLLLIAISSLAIGAAACGSDDGSGDSSGDGDGDGDGTVIDAAPAAPTVTVVDCATATVAGTVTAPGSAYSPANTTITSGEVVKFTMPAIHDAKSRTPGLFHVMFGQEQCLKFEGTGTVEFFCVPHQFTGTITIN
jgi:plastocyanin